MGFIGKAKAKVAYEKESWRLSGQALKDLQKDHPEVFRGKRTKK